MKPEPSADSGMTIIETTVILSVLFILAGVMSPIVSESMTTARAVKAKSDASMIAMGLVNFQKDMGASALSMGGGGLSIQKVSFADVLASAGSQPAVGEAEASEPVRTLLARPGHDNKRDDGAGEPLRGERRRWIETATDSLDAHLRSNRRGHRFRQPGEYGGWNGPYISAELKGDPWGNQYLVNTAFLNDRASAADSYGNQRKAVFVISAGSNGTLETPFDQPITEARPYGDDIVVRIQ